MNESIHRHLELNRWLLVSTSFEETTCQLFLHQMCNNECNALCLCRAVIGEIDEEMDSTLDLTEIRAEPLNAIVH